MTSGTKGTLHPKGALKRCGYVSTGTTFRWQEGVFFKDGFTQLTVLSLPAQHRVTITVHQAVPFLLLVVKTARRLNVLARCIASDVGNVAHTLVFGTQAVGLPFCLYQRSCPVVFFCFAFRPACVFRSTIQIPLAEVYNDARRNVVVAIVIAGNQEIPEVCLFFCDRLLRANRAVKVDR